MEVACWDVAVIAAGAATIEFNQQWPMVCSGRMALWHTGALFQQAASGNCQAANVVHCPSNATVSALCHKHVFVSTHCIMATQLTTAGLLACRCRLSVTAACVAAVLLVTVAALQHIAPSAVAANPTWGTAPVPEHQQEARVLGRQEAYQPGLSTSSKSCCDRYLQGGPH